MKFIYIILGMLLPQVAWAGDLPSAVEWGGHYSFDRHPGFYENAALREAATALIGAKRYKEVLLGWTTSMPIQTDGETVLAMSCKPHDCGDNNQATWIEGGAVRICILERETLTWYVPDRKQPLTKKMASGASSAGNESCLFDSVTEARASLAAMQ